MAIKIMIDAGHYSNYNPSPVYPSYKEGNMTFKLQTYLKAELEKYGFIVGVTRTVASKDLSLYNRETGEMYNMNDLVRNTDIRHGTVLVLM